MFIFKIIGGGMKVYKKERLAPNMELHVMHIGEFDSEYIKKIDEDIVKICEGYSRSSIEEVKKRLFNYLKTKDLRGRQGAISEFFIHLFLNNNKYKQDCLFFNLEDSGPKKGFDGVYSKNNEIFLVESKSGGCSTKNISHLNKIRESHSGLEQYLTGTSVRRDGNPWINAYNHANQKDVKSKEKIIDKIWQLRADFQNGIFSQVPDFNLVPCSTIYLNGEWSNLWSDNLLLEKTKLMSLKGKTIKILSVTNKDMNNFMKYLEAV